LLTKYESGIKLREGHIIVSKVRFTTNILL